MCMLYLTLWGLSSEQCRHVTFLYETHTPMEGKEMSKQTNEAIYILYLIIYCEGKCALVESDQLDRVVRKSLTEAELRMMKMEQPHQELK